MTNIIHTHVKNFIDWFKIKPVIDNKKQKLLFEEREIWMYHCGENIGSEVSGKGDNYLRPIYILKKLSKYCFIGIPLTSKEKNGTWWKKIKVKETMSWLIFSQIKNCDSKRLLYKMDKLSQSHHQEIIQDFKNFLQ